MISAVTLNSVKFTWGRFSLSLSPGLSLSLSVFSSFIFLVVLVGFHRYLSHRIFVSIANVKSLFAFGTIDLIKPQTFVVLIHLPC